MSATLWRRARARRICKNLSRKRLLRVADELGLAVNRSAPKHELARDLGERADLDALEGELTQRERGAVEAQPVELTIPAKAWQRARASSRLATLTRPASAARFEEPHEQGRPLSGCPTRRPCCRSDCRYHLGPEHIDVSKRARYAGRHSCAIEAANTGPMTCALIGIELGLTRERIRQIEDSAREKLARHLDGEEIFIEDLLPELDGPRHPLAAALEGC